MMGAYDGPGACKSCAISYNTEYIVGCYVTEGFCIYAAPTGELIHRVRSEYRVLNVDFSFGDQELAVVCQGKGNGVIVVYDFKDLL